MARPSAKTSVGPIEFPALAGADEGTSFLALAAPALLTCLLAAGPPAVGRAERPCAEDWQAELVTTVGTVERSTANGWEPLESGAVLCHGDKLRTALFSGASVRIDGDGESNSIFWMGADTTITIHAKENETHSWYDVVITTIEGMLHPISRDPRSLSFNTPFVNAGIEGTEFVLQHDRDGTVVTVIEGEVLLSNASGSVIVPGGERGIAAAGTSPRAAAADDTLSAIDWARRFAPIVARELPQSSQVATEAESRSADFYAGRAARRLEAGAADRAAEDLASALTLDPAHPEALGLQALIALAGKDELRAIELAERAVAAAPEDPAGWLALSHAAELLRDSQRALASAETATRAAPAHAYAWARVAELRLKAEDHRGAREAARRAADADPALAHAHTVLGFSELAAGGGAAAEAAFREAVRLDDGDAAARLGLGLSLYRQGQRETAREEMEIAVALDPTNSVIRSYIGKIYDAEDRDALSATQLRLAKALDDDDPSGWFHDAMRKQHENRLGEALLDLREAHDRSGGRTVYGGGSSLDEDLLARSAGIGRMYSSLGFEQLALLAGWRATFDNPGDYTGHRLLADVYSHRTRHHPARVNEVFQALMHQPLNVTPIQAQLADASPFVLDTTGPSSLAFQEYNPLVRENGLSYQISGVTAGNDTSGVDLTVNGLHDRVSYNLSAVDFQTDGFRPNNDFDERIISAIVQVRPYAGTTLTGELRSTDIAKGDLALRYDPSAYLRNLREHETLDSARFSFRKRGTQGTWLGSIVAERGDETIAGIVGNVSQVGTRRGHAFDLQYITDVGAWTLIAGARALEQNQRDVLTGLPIVPVMPMMMTSAGSARARHDIGHGSLYLYGNVDLTRSFRATIGGNLEEVEDNNVTRRRFNPKLGAMWDLSSRTTLRAAWFRTLQSPFISKHTLPPTLEPTHVIGFNQQYFGVQGEEAERWGIALDHEFAENVFGGIELARRDLDMKILRIEPGAGLPTVGSVDREERYHMMYAYWLPSPLLSVAASYEYERHDGGETALPEGFKTVSTHRLPVELNFNHRSGFSAGLTTTVVDQAGEFDAFLDGGPTSQQDAERFLVMDVSLGFRLPSRRGQISLNILNAMNEQFRFQDIDPENPRILPERLAQLRFTLSY